MLLNKLLNNGGEFELRPGSQIDVDGILHRLFNNEQPVLNHARQCYDYENVDFAANRASVDFLFTNCDLAMTFLAVAEKTRSR